VFFERNIKLHKQQKVACKKRAWLLANPYFKPFIRRHENQLVHLKVALKRLKE
jgi:hypothetical protein